MENKRIRIGDYVKAVRWEVGTEWVKGTFKGFYLINTEDPDSVVGVVEAVSADGIFRCYNVYPRSIEPWEGRIVELAKSIGPRHIEALREAVARYRGVSWSMPLADLLAIIESLRSSL